jgi:MIP family channel proteins
VAEDFLYSFSQKLLAEFVGTFTIVLIAIGSICADQYLRAASLARPGLLAQALAYGVAVAVMMLALAPISGGHFNPAITAGLWVTKRIGSLQAILYCAAQLAGAVVAAYILVALLPEATWRPVSLGATDLATDFTRMNGMLIEGLATFLVTFVFFACTPDVASGARPYAGIAVGLIVALGVLFVQPFTGASMNPARTFGPALAARHWVNHGVYWVGPLFGGVAGGVAYEYLFAPKSEA